MSDPDQPAPDVSADQVDRLLAELDPAGIEPAAFRDLIAGVGAITFDLSRVSPEAFATLISRASKEHIKAISDAEPVRRQVLDAIFHRMPERFRPHRAPNAVGVALWRIGDRPDGGHDEYQLAVDRGVCTVTSPPDREPRVTITAGIVEFVQLASGNANAPMMFLTGRLKVRGDLPFAVNLLGYFAIPKPS